MFSARPTAYLVMGPDLVIVEADPAYLQLLGRTRDELIGRYVFGAAGPSAYDCSSFTRAAYARIGIRLPRTAAAQRSWLAAGNGTRIPPGREKAGDLIFWDSYRGPNQIGHVVIVWDPATKTTIEARSTRDGIGHFSYTNGPRRNIFQIWRVNNITTRG